MKLIKILPDRIQIKSDDIEFANTRLNDLISISDGTVTLVTMISSMTDNDPDLPIDEEDFISEQLPTVKVIGCSILGSLIDGKFSNSLDKYPTTDITAEVITNEQFAEMLNGNKDNSFQIGTYSNYDCPAWIDGNKFYQRHSCIVGNTGCGKSETVTKIIEETAKNTNCNIVVFDIHGEYSKLSYVDNIDIGKEPFPIWMFGFSDIVTNILKVREETASVIMSALRKAYKQICVNVNESKPIYFAFQDLIIAMENLNNEQIETGEVYKSGAKEGQAKTVKGDYNGKLNSILNTMKAIWSDKRYDFLFKHTEPEYLNEFMNRIMGGDKPVKNINLSNVPHDIAILIIGVLTKLIYNIQLMQEQGEYKPITLICDEAHVYIPVDFQLTPSQRRMVEIFENIAKEGRKFGITIIPATQRPTELNKTIMAQCANYIVMKLNNENDKTMIKGMLPEGNSGVIETTTMFQPGDCLVIGDITPIPMKIHVDLADERPQSRTIDFWNEWKDGKRIENVDSYIEEYLMN